MMEVVSIALFLVHCFTFGPRSFLSVVNVIEKGHRLVNGRIFSFRESNHGFMISPEKN